MGGNMKRIAVIGYGRFGRALTDLANERGLEVRAFDLNGGVPEAFGAPSAAAAAAGAEGVVIAVPVTAMRGVLDELAPHLGPSQLVLDVGSVKLGPVATMRATLGARVPWVGTHPLFGPTSLALGERPLRVVVCPNELHPSAALRARALYAHLGCEVIEEDAETHDRAMADTHALAFYVAKGLLDSGAGEGVPFTPPSFQAIARTIEAVRSDAGHLFFAIQHENPYAGAARRRLLDALTNIDQQLEARAASEGAQGFAIPDLGPSSPDLKEARELIDLIDRELIELIDRRAELSRRAGRAKAEQGLAVQDVERERALLVERGAWAEARGLDPEGVRDVFLAVLRFSRSVQRR